MNESKYFVTEMDGLRCMPFDPSAATYQTSGDKIREVFPDLKFSTTDGKVFVRNEGEEYLSMCFSWKWWNTPYEERR